MSNARIILADFDRYLGEATILALDALSAFELFYFLTSPEQKHKYAEAFKKHELVFQQIRKAAFSTLILSLHKLLEDARNPVSIYRCISMACRLLLINRDQGKALKNRIHSVAPIGEKVGEVRDHLIAHRDCSVPVSRVFETAKIAPKELRELALAYWEVLNALRHAAGRKAFDAVDYSDHLFRALQSLMSDALPARQGAPLPQG